MSEQEKNRLNEILRDLVRKKGGRLQASALWGTSERTLAGYLSGESDPKLSFLSRVASSEGFSVADFFTSHAENSTSRKDADLIAIPLRDIYASAGPGVEVIDEEPSAILTFGRTFVAEWGRSPVHVEAIHARGDSMEPTIQNGAVVLIDRAERALVEGRVFAFRTSDGLRLKRFQRTIDGSALLVSDNKELYAPERISISDLEQLRVAGRAFWTGRMI